MTTWIIDGNNLIHRDPRLRAILQQSGFAAARHLLESELGRRRGGGHDFHVVYDGGTGGRRGAVRTDIAAEGRTADEEILRLARARGGQGDIRVVTSDRHDIGTRLPGLSIEWVSAESFRSVLWGTARDGAESEEDAGAEKPSPPRGSEVDRWLEIFGEEPRDDS